MLYNKECEHLGMGTDARALSAWHLLQTKQGKTSAQAECSLLAGMMPRFSSHMALPCSGKKPRFSQRLVWDELKPGRKTTSVWAKVAAPGLLSSAGSVRTVKRSSPGKGGMLCHAIFGWSSKTSAVSPSLLNAAFSACAAESPGTAGVEAARRAAGGGWVLEACRVRLVKSALAAACKIVAVEGEWEAAASSSRAGTVVTGFSYALRSSHVNSWGGFVFF